METCELQMLYPLLLLLLLSQKPTCRPTEEETEREREEDSTVIIMYWQIAIFTMEKIWLYNTELRLELKLLDSNNNSTQY